MTWGLGSLPSVAVVGAAVAMAAAGAFVPAVLAPGPRTDGASPVAASPAGGVDPAGDAGAVGGSVGLDAGHAGGLDTPADVASAPSTHGRLKRTLGLVRNLLSIVLLPFLGFLTFVFITGGYRFPAGLMAVDTETTGALLAVAVVLAVCLPRYRTPLALIVEKIAVPACVACSIVLGSFPNNMPLFLAGAASVFALLIFMGVYAGALFAVVSKGDESPSAFAVGVALFLACTVSTLGVTVSTVARVDLGPWAWVVICAYFGLVIVDLGVASWRRIAHPAPEGVAGLPADAEDQVDAESKVERRVQGLVRSCGLSVREGEILGYLARGYNSTYIARRCSSRPTRCAPTSTTSTASWG